MLSVFEGTIKALSWANLRFAMSAYGQHYYGSVVFWDTLSSDLIAAARPGQLEVVPSRLPGGYPKLESPTLSHPALEPLTEHHAFRLACSIEAVPSNDTLGVNTMLSVCLAARQVRQHSELRTYSILLRRERVLDTLRGLERMRQGKILNQRLESSTVSRSRFLRKPESTDTTGTSALTVGNVTFSSIRSDCCWWQWSPRRTSTWGDSPRSKIDGIASES
jgi:hypothetical protein